VEWAIINLVLEWTAMWTFWLLGATPRRVNQDQADLPVNNSLDRLINRGQWSARRDITCLQMRSIQIVGLNENLNYSDSVTRSQLKPPIWGYLLGWLGTNSVRAAIIPRPQLVSRLHK